MTSEDNVAQKQGVDTLLHCLLFIGKYYALKCSKNAILAGLPLVNNQLTPGLFEQAANYAGLSSKIVQRSLHDIPDVVLPCVLLLQQDKSCVLLKKIDDQVSVYYPTMDKTETHSLDELEALYQGYAIFLQLASTSGVVSTAKPMAWFWDNFWRHRSVHIQVIIASLLINIFTLVGPLYVMNVYDRVIPNNAVMTLWVLSSGVLVIYLFDFILRLLRSYYIDVSNKKNDIVMAGLLFQRVLGMKLQHKPASVGLFANNFREFDALREFFSSVTLVSFIDLPFAILFLILTYYLGGALVLVPLVAIPIVVLTAVFTTRPIKKAVAEMTQGAAKKNSVLVESVMGLETLKCLNAEGLLQHRWEAHVSDTARASLRSRFLSSLVSSVSYYTQQMVTIANLVVGFYLIYEGQLTVGGVIACNILSGRTVIPFIQLTTLLSRFQQSWQALQSLDKIAATPQERDRHLPLLSCPAIKGSFELHQVNFHYPNQDKLVLNQLSIKISPGEKIAIIGRIGSGKSTIIKLLLSLYGVTNGSVWIDGIDICQLDPSDIRHHIGYVSQDYLLFAGTIRDNIIMGMPTATDEQIQQAAQVAGVDSFVNHHPLGFNQPVGERGEQLSGGQRQSVALARALINNPSILFLDEPTSAMDNNTEQEILGRLHAYATNKTLVITTHKFSLLPLVNRLIVIDNGKVIMDGPKDEVINAFNKAGKPS